MDKHRLSRIERKCDRIIAELEHIRRADRERMIDETLGALHASALRMRRECRRERRLLARLLG